MHSVIDSIDSPQEPTSAPAGPQLVPMAYFEEHLAAWRANSAHQAKRIAELEAEIAALKNTVSVLSFM